MSKYAVYYTHTNYRILGKNFFFMELACFQLFKTNGLFMEMSHENHSKGGGGGSDESDTQNFQNLVNKVLYGPHHFES